MKELKFVDLKYKPKDDIISLLKIVPNKMSVKEAANVVALESSVGTWTDIKERDYVKKLRARVFSIMGNYVQIAYPSQLFEPKNIPNILSSIAGNIMGMKVVKSIRLEDVSFPKSILKDYDGPQYGIEGVRKIMKVKKRPFIGTIIKPKLGLNSSHHALSAYQSWVGGCDFVKDDENLSSQKFNQFNERITKTLKMQDKAEKETGEKKAYFANVTSETKEMLKRAQFVQDNGGKYVMIDVLTSGWAAVQTLRQANFKLAIHAHRAMHAAFDRNPEQGISMMVIADFARLAGVDQIHIGTGIGKLEGKIKDVQQLSDEIEKQRIKQTKLRLEQNWNNIKPVLSVSSGGLHPRHVPFLVKNLGNDLVIQMGGGIHGHPQGTIAGARAARQAVEAVMAHQDLEKYSLSHPELAWALKTWK
ncbi:MAG: type III ribulose-bisphosphate carboxylase [Candidatus Pacearchaeota archaeon]|jgi:ribulose-bisphosphate carboxylase large chain